jgi:hypothetical protein
MRKTLVREIREKYAKSITKIRGKGGGGKV